MTSSATATTRGVVQAKKIVTAKGTTTTIIDECGGLDGIAAQVNVNSSPSPLPSANNTNVKFPAPPPPVMNANVSRVNVSRAH
ncbi:unnamed protein product [Anisakis simplex]|uniref:Ice-structuring protein 4-like n=1 Tax=Anisakis simplex TaxID=6269 RepID=A0A0M3JHK1_ANISI|nr:unnamed protein product [Anisakis simplex]